MFSGVKEFRKKLQLPLLHHAGTGARSQSRGPVRLHNTKRKHNKEEKKGEGLGEEGEGMRRGERGRYCRKTTRCRKQGTHFRTSAAEPLGF